jgi:hypothetical protein
MIDILKPLELLEMFQEKKISDENIINSIQKISEESDNHLIRELCIKIISIIKNNKNYFKFLENIAISDENMKVRMVACRTMFKSYPNKFIDFIENITKDNSSIFDSEFVRNIFKLIVKDIDMVAFFNKELPYSKYKEIIENFIESENYKGFIVFKFIKHYKCPYCGSRVKRYSNYNYNNWNEEVDFECGLTIRSETPIIFKEIGMCKKSIKWLKLKENRLYELKKVQKFVKENVNDVKLYKEIRDRLIHIENDVKRWWSS